MKQIIILSLLTIFSFTKVNASMSPVVFKAKFVLKNKTSFTAYYLTWDTETYDTKGISMLEPDYKVTDKEFQLFLNKQNNKGFYDIESGKSMKGTRLYKNIYGIQKPENSSIPKFGFCNKKDVADIYANDILYTVFLGMNNQDFPEFDNYGMPIEALDSTSTQDLKKNKIIANFVLYDSNDLSYSFHFVTTDKTISSKKLETLIRSKKYTISRMATNPQYYNSIKKEMAKLQIYLFSEYQD